MGSAMTVTDAVGRTPVELSAAVDATQRWNTLLALETTDAAEQTRLHIAGKLADAAVAGAARAGWLRPQRSAALDPLNASEAWSRIALLWHQVLIDVDAFTTARANANAACHFDPGEVRAWLERSDGEVAVGDNLLGADFG